MGFNSGFKGLKVQEQNCIRNFFHPKFTFRSLRLTWHYHSVQRHVHSAISSIICNHSFSKHNSPHNGKVLFSTHSLPVTIWAWDPYTQSIIPLLIPTWYTIFIYIKLSSSTCFERHPLIFRRSMMLIVHVCSLWYSHSLQVAVLCTC